MKKQLQCVLAGLVVLLCLVAGFAAEPEPKCPNMPPINLPATRGAMVNADGSPVASGQLKFYPAKEVAPTVYHQSGYKETATVSTDNQGAFDFSSIPGGVYVVNIKQKRGPSRTVLLRLPAKAPGAPVNKKEIWIKLAANECDGFFVYVPNQ